MTEFENYKKGLDEIEHQLSEGNFEYEQVLFYLESEINSLKGQYSPESIQKSTIEKLSKRIEKIKNEYDIFDKEAQLDRMFPNRHDEDFDEDSMSFESVFGKN